MAGSVAAAVLTHGVSLSQVASGDGARTPPAGPPQWPRRRRHLRIRRTHGSPGTKAANGGRWLTDAGTCSPELRVAWLLPPSLCGPRCTLIHVSETQRCGSRHRGHGPRLPAGGKILRSSLEPRAHSS